MIAAALALAVLFAVAAWFYVRRAKHPEMRRLAAWAVFLSIFTMVAGGLFFITTRLIFAVEGAQALSASPTSIVIAVLAVGLGFVIARLLIKRPPRKASTPR